MMNGNIFSRIANRLHNNNGEAAVDTGMAALCHTLFDDNTISASDLDRSYLAEEHTDELDCEFAVLSELEGMLLSNR